MVIKTLDEHIETTPNVMRGKPRIVGHRISVQDIAIWHEKMGQTAGQIAGDYHLSIADVYAALAYYYDHRTEIDLSISEGEKFVDEMKKKIPSKVKKNLRGD